MGKKVKFTVLMLLIALILAVSCKKPGGGVPTQTPPENKCGEGSGIYFFSVDNYPPSSFDCNSAGSFSIEITPGIDASYSGFNRLYFELEKDFKIYRSNYVEFYSGNSVTQQLEFGGSLPTGTYTAEAYMQNIQLNSTCTDSIFVADYCWLGNINIIEFSNLQKVMNIEYFCQSSDTSIIPRYDVFLSPNTGEYMDIAFNIANTRDSVTTYQTNLTSALVEANIQRVKEYIAYYKQSGDKMFLCGIKGFKDASGNYLDYITGWAEWDPIN